MSDTDNSRAIARAEKKVDRSRQFILQKECFFSTVMLGLKVIMDEHGTMSTNGTTWKWGWRFVDEADQYKVNFVNLHERAHEALFHCTRVIPLKDKVLANIAADHVVNIMITRMGLRQQFTDNQFRGFERDWIIRNGNFKHPSYKMPEDGVMDPKFAGMTLEEVYDILAHEDENEDKGEGEDEGEGEGEGESKGESKGEDGDKPGTSRKPAPWGEVQEAVNDETGDPLTPKEIKEREQELSQTLATAENIAKSRGQMPGIVSENVKLAQGASQDWRDVLRDLLLETIPADYTYARQDTHNMGNVLVSPGILKEGMGHLAVFTDASGSISQGEFSQFLTDLTMICEDLLPDRITFVQFDSAASNPVILEQGDVPELVRQRQGGTRFSAPFDKCDDLGLTNDFDTIIVFTDGEDYEYPRHEPPCPVIWATTGVFMGGGPPWGEVIGVRFKK